MMHMQPHPPEIRPLRSHVGLRGRMVQRIEWLYSSFIATRSHVFVI